MPSPFPGMDPYLEAHWRDIHAGLVIYSRDALQAVLPPALRARVEERVLLELPTGTGSHPLFPDVRIVEYGPRRQGKVPAGAVAMAEPLVLEVEPITETWIEIIDSETGNRVVTIIEFLSPSNKSPGMNRDLYTRKQREICRSDTNLVEIDLNRFGIHTLAFPLGLLKPAYRTPYMGCVRRATRKGQAEIYSMPLSARLPSVKIPLRPSDVDVSLDLQMVVEQCYRNGGYEGTLNYGVEPDPPLSGEEQEWAEKWLREKGLRVRKKPGRRKKPKS